MSTYKNKTKENKRIRRGGRFAVLFWVVVLAAMMTAPIHAAKPDLPKILKGTAAYCEKLGSRAFHFLCREQIDETCEKAYDFPFNRRGLKDFFEKNKSAVAEDLGGSKNWYDRQIAEMRKNRAKRNYNPKKYSRKNIYVNEYRILKDGGRIKEQRLVIQQNGEKVSVTEPKLQTILYSYRNTLMPIYLFARQNQEHYRYKLVKKTRAMNRAAYEIQVTAKKGKKNQRKLAVAWIDADDFSVLKLKVFPAAFHGYDYLLGKPTGWFDVKINDLHYFGYQKDGLRFPTRTEIYLSYKEEADVGIEKVKHGAIVLNTISTIYTYGDYLFYRTTPSEPVFKKEYKQ